MTYTNVHEFTGRVSNAVETKYLPSSKVVSKFNVAVKRPYASDEPTYHTCECWGKLAETAANYLEIGKAVTVTGEMKVQSWTDKETDEPRSKAVFTVNKLDMLTGAKKAPEPTTI